MNSGYSKYLPNLILIVSLFLVSCGGGGGGDPIGTPKDTSPKVSATSPANAAINVVINGAIAAYFCCDLDPVSVNSTTFTVSTVMAGTILGTVSSSGTTATFTPASPLANNSSYTATLTTGIKRLTGEAMKTNYSWTFTTGSQTDITPPTVASSNPTSPVAGATYVANNTAVSATFSEALTASTVSTATFTLSSGAGAVAGTVAYSGTTATFIPTAVLAYSTLYTATLTTGIKDLASNSMAVNYTWTFTTVNAPTLLASGLGAEYITVDSTSVYWTATSGAVKKVDINGGPVTILASGLTNQPVFITVDSTSVYWAEWGSTSGAVKKVGINGGPVTTLASGNGPWGIAIDSTSVYWTECGTGTIKKVGKNGGPVTTLASGQNGLFSIAVDSTSVYWPDSLNGTIKKVGINGGPVTIIATTGFSSPQGNSIAVDSTSVYWPEWNSGTIKKVGINGGTVTTLASGIGPFGIAVDSTSVYWTEYDNSGAVKKVSINGGTVTTLASRIGPFGIAVDPTNVYWTENMGSEIYKINK